MRIFAGYTSDSNVSSNSVMCVFMSPWGLKGRAKIQYGTVSMSNCRQLKSATHHIQHIYTLHENKFTCSKYRKNVKKKKDDKHATGSMVVMLKPELLPLFANAKLTKLMLLGRKPLNYLRLKKPQITQCLILFRYGARAFTSLCYEKTSIEWWVCVA